MTIQLISKIFKIGKKSFDGNAGGDIQTGDKTSITGMYSASLSTMRVRR